MTISGTRTLPFDGPIQRNFSFVSSVTGFWPVCTSVQSYFERCSGPSFCLFCLRLTCFPAESANWGILTAQVTWLREFLTFARYLVSL